MSVSLTIDGTPFSDGGFVAMPDESAGIAAADHELLFTNNGPSTITVTACATNAEFGLQIQVTPPGTLPTLTSGQSMTVGFKWTGRGPLAPTTVPCCVTGKIEITYTIGASPTVVTSSVHLAGRFIGVGVVPTISFEDFLNDWVAEGFQLASAATTVDNPLSFNYGINDHGHEYWFETYVRPALNAGMVNVFGESFFGHDGSANLRWEQYRSTVQFGNPLYYAHFAPMIQTWHTDFPSSKLWAYMGGMKDATFVSPLTAHDADRFVELMLAGMQPYYGAPQLSRLCWDDPYWNSSQATADLPESKPGEARFEAMTMVKDLLATRNIKIHVEPRGLDADTWWRPAHGFNRVMAARSWWRNNPAWYADASGATVDAHCGDMILIYENGTTDLMTYQIAEALNQGLLVPISTAAWRGAGGTLFDLYTEVMAHLNAINGFIS